MDRVLSSVDLLSLIIECLNTSSQVNCARVCKTWSDIAIRNIWYCMVDMKPLFQFFPSLDNEKDGRSEGVLIDDDSWIKFRKYAGYVKQLIITPDNDNALHHIYQEIAFTKSTKHILPNLKELTAYCGRHTLLHLGLLMHDGLRDLQIQKIRNVTDARRCLHHMVHRAPNITNLVLSADSTIDSRPFEADLQTTFSQLKSLQFLVMYSFAMTPATVCALGSLPKLNSLSFRSSTTNYENMHPMFVSVPDFDSETTPFALLENVSLDIDMAGLMQLLAMDMRFNSARFLKIQTVIDITGISLRSCFPRLAYGWRHLQELDLKVFPYFGKEDLYEDLNFNKLIPLLDLHDLRALSILHPSCLSITDENAEQMALNWPKMRHLKLNPAPFVTDSLNLTLAALKSFATHCKELESLAIFVDATETDNLPPITARSEKLTNLKFCASPIDDPEPVASYVQQCCSTSCQISLTLEMEEEIGTAMNVVPDPEYRRGWTEVAKLLELSSELLDRESQV